MSKLGNHPVWHFFVFKGGHWPYEFHGQFVKDGRTYDFRSEMCDAVCGTLLITTEGIEPNFAEGESVEILRGKQNMGTIRILSGGQELPRWMK